VALAETANRRLKLIEMTDSTWVFGYGSLIWWQDFPWLEARRAHITGWSRRFWQGSHDHRGVAADPGRVVTLVEASGERCYGRAFLSKPEVFAHLDHREKNGYERHPVDIGFAEGRALGVVYIAAPDNPAFLGDAPLVEMVAQIKRCAGPSGTNVDYLLELAKALRNLRVSDSHVFELEALVLETRIGQVRPPRTACEDAMS
jgi:cation transport regulator ChaC